MAAGTRKRNRGRRSQPMSEINVTPFVDVMLVLLVIFMVTAPLMTAGVNVDLPKSSSEPINVKDEPLTVSITKKGKIFLQESEINLKALPAKLASVTKIKKKNATRIIVKADKNINYGKVMEVIDKINSAGFKKVALQTDIQ